MNGNNFAHLYKQAVSQAHAVAMWRLPNETHAHLTFQLTPHPQHWVQGADGFMFHPFAVSAQCPVIFIKAEQKISIPVEDLPTRDTETGEYFFAAPVEQQFADEVTFTRFIQQSKQAIEQNRFQKIVAARAAHIETKQPLPAFQLFRELCLAYPQAFVSLVHSRETGTWAGATPETLLSNRNGVLKTMALAGTVAEEEKRNWTDKEKTEQLPVKQFIERVFNAQGLHPQISATQELQAGNHLKHLINYFEATLPSGFNFSHLQSVIQQLHPTPAVAGLPKQDAIDWILQHEPLARFYYSGFLGPVFADNNFDLFVNLRCMQATATGATLYAGAGITAQSDPHLEWMETERKMQTIGKVLQKV